MKKSVYLLIAVAAIMIGCTNGPKRSQLITENDSLKTILAERDAALDEMIKTINIVEEGFEAINAAQGRINLDAASTEQSKMMKLQKDINFINETLANNRAQIAELEQKLSSSESSSKQLKSMVQKLKKELEAKSKQIIALQEELANKNIHIAELDKTVEELSSNVTSLSKTKAKNEQTISKQESELNSVWYAIGTKSELKEMNIISGKKVLEGGNAQMDYFTKADKRELTTIDTHEKNAKLLTTHPENSYKLERNKDKKYVLTITNPEKFWSVSKYLVIQVR